MWFLRRCVILVPLLFVLLANRVSAESYDLECIQADTSLGDAWLCKQDWDGSRISDEQRKSVNVLVVSSLMFPKGRKR